MGHVGGDDGAGHYAEARTDDVDAATGSSVLRLSLDSPNGGVLSYKVMASIMAPFEDVLVKLDGEPVDVIISAVEEWAEGEVRIESGGSHEVEWVHRKNPENLSAEELGAVGMGSEGVTRIDDIEFRPS